MKINMSWLFLAYILKMNENGRIWVDKNHSNDEHQNGSLKSKWRAKKSKAITVWKFEKNLNFTFCSAERDQLFNFYYK